MSLPPLIQQLDTKLAGLPDQILTVILLAVSSIGIAVALFANPTLKAIVTAWFIAP